MIKPFFIVSFLLFPVLASAESCFPLYEKEGAALRGEKYVGGGLMVMPAGQLGYNPGIKITDNQFNWAQNLVDGIKWGPYMKIGGGHKEDPRQDWLELFRKSVKSECKLSQGDYTELRAMLRELMEDGSFCPNQKILEPGFMGNRKEFKKVFVNAVKDGKFAQHCQTKAVKDDSFRDVKDVDQKKSNSEKNSKSSKQ